jgi:type IV secretory pathway VirB4 component
MNLYVLEGAGLFLIVVALVIMAFRTLPRLPYNIAKTRSERSRGFDELIVPEYLIKPGMSFNEDGSLTTGYVLSGPDATVKTEGAMARLVGDWNAILSSTSEPGLMYEIQRVRRPAPAPQEEPFCPTAAHAVMRDARAANPNTQCWDDHVALLLTYLPPEGISSVVSRMLIQHGGDTIVQRDRLTAGLEALEERCRVIEATLRTCMVKVERMGIVQEDHDSLVDTFYKNINGWGLPGISLPGMDEIDSDTGLFVEPIALRERLAVQDFDGALLPRYGQEHIRCLSLATFPDKRRPGLLAELARLAIPYRDHTRLIIEHPEAMKNHLQRRFNDEADNATPVFLMGGPKNRTIAEATVDLDARDKLKEMQIALREHNSGLRQFAFYSRVIELRSTDLEELDRWTRAVSETLRVSGFNTRTEEMHAVDAWLSTLAANGYNFVRRTAAHGVMVGDLTNLTDAWRGRERIKCDKCDPGVLPMAIVRRADTLAPFALDLHAGEGDVMSSVVVGPIRFGKTTLVNFIIAHFRKTARDRIVGIDYLRSEERTAVMLEGSYGVPGEGEGARLCPFTGINTVDGRRRAVEWCELVATLNMPANSITGDLLNRFSEAVDLLASSPSWEQEACVTLFLQKLSADKSVKDTFRAYADGGTYGHIFDATPEQMHFWSRDLRIYDTTILHSLSQRAMLPALVVMCADTERQIDGRRMLLVIEEAHIALKHDWMKKWLITLLRTNRKKHLGIIFVLTDLEGIEEYVLRTLKSLCGTVFATGNPNVNATRGAYRFLGFDDRTIDMLVPSSVTETRRDGLPAIRYKYWQLGEDGIAPFELGLSSVELEVLARGNDRDKERTAIALRAHPKDTPAAIFEAVKLPAAAEEWREYDAEIPKPAAPLPVLSTVPSQSEERLLSA